jgi:alpha-L-fucosidase
VFGEGPTATPQGHLADLAFDGFTSEDVRYTRAKDGSALYAILLGWPSSRRVFMRNLSSTNGVVSDVQFLGHEEALTWTQTGEGLEVRLPESPPFDHAFVLKVHGREAW